MGFTIDLLAEPSEQVNALGYGESFCQQGLVEPIAAKSDAVKHQGDV